MTLGPSDFGQMILPDHMTILPWEFFDHQTFGPFNFDHQTFRTRDFETIVLWEMCLWDHVIFGPQDIETIGALDFWTI